MTVKLITYFWIIITLMVIAFLFIYFPVVSAIKYFKGERFEGVRTYSYSKVIKVSVLSAIILSIVSSIIYLETGSGELALTLFAFFIACTIGGMIRSLNLESHAKSRGAIKEE